MGAAEKSYEEIVDLFARGGGSGAVLAFRPSEDAQARMRALLSKSKTDALTDDEQAELDRFGELERLMQLVRRVPDVSRAPSIRDPRAAAPAGPRS